MQKSPSESEKALLQLRSQLDQIHEEMARLFQQRLQVCLKIWELKNQNQISLIDTNRENEIIHRFDQWAGDENEKMALQNFFKAIIAECKDYTGKQLK